MVPVMPCHVLVEWPLPVVSLNEHGIQEWMHCNCSIGDKSNMHKGVAEPACVDASLVVF